jgi:hypothetical protein
MGGGMSFKMWSDEDRLFIPRLGGWSINFKYIARKLGWVKTPVSPKPPEEPDASAEAAKTAEGRLRQSVERSRFEDR